MSRSYRCRPWPPGRVSGRRRAIFASGRGDAEGRSRWPRRLIFASRSSGPAAWGMTERPELARYDRPGPRAADPGPARSRPLTSRPSAPLCIVSGRLRAGEAVLPPISIASFDPSLTRYMTQVTPGVPIRVVAVPAFDPATIDDGRIGPRRGLDRSWRDGLRGLCRRSRLLAAYTPCWSWYAADCAAGRSPERPRPGDTPRVWLVAWQSVDAGPDGTGDCIARCPEGPVRPRSPGHVAARRVSDELIHYLQLGTETAPRRTDSRGGLRRASRQ